MRSCLAALLLLSSLACRAQWTALPTPTKAKLLAVHTVGDAVWASGADGTVLRSADAGATWQLCAVPQKADLRSVQAIDAVTALVMTSGKGEASKVFRTADGCNTWTPVFTNPEEASSFDGLQRMTAKQFYLLSEPVNGKFVLYLSRDAGLTWFIADDPGLDADPGESAAASTLSARGPFVYFGTGGAGKPYVHFTYAKCDPAHADAGCSVAWARAAVADGTGSVHGVATRSFSGMSGKMITEAVAAGAAGTASLVASAAADGAPWALASNPPVTPEAAIAFDPVAQLWIAVGTGGTDVSADRKRWKHVGLAAGAAPAWTAMSLPFAVGADGAVGKLERTALK